MKLDQAFVKAVESPVWTTWSAIGYDVAQLEGRMSNSGNMEMVLDAGRMSTFAGEKGKAADALLDVAIKEHGYEKVSRFLCKHIKLNC